MLVLLLIIFVVLALAIRTSTLFADELKRTSTRRASHESDRGRGDPERVDVAFSDIPRLDRIQVFLSSVMNVEVEDLSSDRSLVRNCIRDEELFGLWSFEDAPADSELRNSYLSKVEACHIFVIIIGRSCTPAVADELASAIAHKKPVLAFVKTATTRFPEAERLLHALQTNDIRYKTYDTLAQLENELPRALYANVVKYYERGLTREAYLLLLVRSRVFHELDSRGHESRAIGLSQQSATDPSQTVLPTISIMSVTPTTVQPPSDQLLTVGGRVVPSDAIVAVVLNPHPSDTFLVQPRAVVTHDGIWQVRCFLSPKDLVKFSTNIDILAFANPAPPLREGAVLSGWPAAAARSEHRFYSFWH